MTRITVLFGLLLASFSATATDLTGMWVGYYSYSDSNRVPMSVSIESDGNDFMGTMIELSTNGNDKALGRPAIISGTIHDGVVIFDKAYFSDLESTAPLIIKDGAHKVRYMLTMSQSGHTLIGSWSIGEMYGKAIFKRLTTSVIDEIP